jgi:hypothetical protein
LINRHREPVECLKLQRDQTWNNTRSESRQIHAPIDMADCGLNTRSMLMKRRGRPDPKSAERRDHRCNRATHIAVRATSKW